MPKKHTLQLSIPKPCTQGWDNMTPNEKGRHCDSCNKTVVDFTLFTDRQIIEFFQKAKYGVCGHIPKYKLQRQLVYTEPQNHFLYKLLFGTAIAVGFAGSANAAYNPKQTSLIEQYIGSRDNEPLLDGGKDTLRVKVVDSANGDVLPFASVAVYYNNNVVGSGQTNIDGNLIITGLKQYDFNQLSMRVTYTGYREYLTSQINPDMKISLNSNGVVLTNIIDGYMVPFVYQNNSINVNLSDSKTGKSLSNVSVKLIWNNVEQSTIKTDSLGNAVLKYEADLRGLKLVVHIAEQGYQTIDKKIVAAPDRDVAIKLKPVKK